MSEDVGKSTLADKDLRDASKTRRKVVRLTDNAGWITAVGNDLAYDEAEPVVSKLFPIDRF